MGDWYNAAFRCTAYDTIPRRGGADLPGGQIARDLAGLLSKLGVTVKEVVPEEPWWAVRVEEGRRNVDILVYVFLPDDDRSNAIWYVSVPSEESSFLDFFKKDEPESRNALIRSVHEALKRVPHVYDIRWFRGDGGDPFAGTPY